ncbi:MAG: DoxX family membrane protein [Verrucomicrobia bacterium]|nr:DoxX family membrane protein [Verrucomicrobiota bacterium]
MDPECPQNVPTSPAAALDAALGYALLRFTFGLNFLLHSYQRWLDLGKFVNGTVHQFTTTPLPEWSVRAFATAIPFIEPLLGALILTGLWTRSALVAGALFIAALTFGTALRNDYAVLSVQLLYALTFFLLLLTRGHNRFSVDAWLTTRGLQSSGSSSSPSTTALF